MLKTLKLCAAVAAAALVTAPVFGADFPSKPLKLIVTSPAGGGEDTEARAIAPFVEKLLGQQVIIENQGGAGGKIAFEKFQNVTPDGYTLITYTFPKSVIMEYQGKTGFKTRDFTPIFAWSRSSQLLVVNAESWKTFPEFLKAAKEKPLSGGLSGRGSTTHLMGLIGFGDLGIDKVNWVPYQGGAGSVAALAGKHLEFTLCLAGTAVPLIQAGKLRPLLLFSDKRDPYLPDVPIPKEFGYDMNFLPTLRGVEAPPNTPADIVKILEDAFRTAVQDKDFIDIATKRKVVLVPVGSKEFAKAVADAYVHIAKYQSLLKR
jgi:tripartite-type tricarboxylate transporter receptor subunit TctC